MNRHTKFALSAFLLAAAIYFTLRFTGVLATCEWFMIVPTLVASLAAFANGAKGGYLIPLALLASTAGDYGGAIDAFLPQVSCFAVAHILYICDFVPRCHFTLKRLYGAIVCSLPLLGYLSFIPIHSHSVEESVAVGLYGAIILTMVLTTIFREGKHRAWYIAASTIFVFSDAVIVYTRFIDSIPHDGTIIMSTYYAAQGIFLTLHSLRQSTQD